MKVRIPIQTKEIKDGKLIKSEIEKDFDLDTSLASQIRFESKFPNLAEVEDLYSYTTRISKVEGLSVPLIISKMKVLYCWFDTEITFVDFLKLFDLSDIQYIEKLTSKMREVFNIVFDTSAEKNL